MKYIPIFIIAFIGVGAFLTSCDSDLITKQCDTCNVPCDTCDTTDPCDTCDTTKGDPDSLAHAFTWTEHSIPGEVNITGCWVFNENLIYAMGDKLWKWNGTLWQQEKVFIRGTQREAGLADGRMFALSPSDMWFVAGWVYHYHDGAADELSSGSPVLTCWGTSSSDMFFVGKNGSIVRFNGETFTTFPKVTNEALREVWGTSRNDIWACGYNSTTGISVLVHYNGFVWSEVDRSKIGDPSPGILPIRETWSTDSLLINHLAHVSGPYVFREKNRNEFWWKIDSLPNKLPGGSISAMYLMHGNGANDFFVSGGWGMVVHWNGRTWKRYDELYQSSNPNYIGEAIHQKGNTVCVVGSKNGASWIAIGRRKP